LDTFHERRVSGILLFTRLEDDTTIPGRDAIADRGMDVIAALASNLSVLEEAHHVGEG
jgi:hypothetical protein